MSFIYEVDRILVEGMNIGDRVVTPFVELRLEWRNAQNKAIP